ncbi:hypothetical protein SLS62_009359 [Diatrype stigma]|uniref:TRP C-terminal domain-containing protein n=1 Tax=Diatrype stigma TaxID=117547 RepID=A0AAN9UGY2_9PEZI
MSSGLDDDALAPQSLSGKVEHVNGTHDRLSLEVSRWIDEAQCARVIRSSGDGYGYGNGNGLGKTSPVAATLDIQMLGRGRSSHRLDAAGAVVCRSLQWHMGMSSLELTFVEDIDRLHPLSTFGVTLLLDDDYGIFQRESCVRANITPDIDFSSRMTLTFGPLCIFLFVLVAGVIRSVYSGSSGSSGSGSASALAARYASSGEEEASRPRSILPDVGDCLHYLQFVFLTGSLSLAYPGFYQPAVSHLDGYSLFSRGLIRPDWQYEGTSDGIYVVNGTYGGTFGLELMTQVVGAPLTWGTWMNMVVSIGIIALAAAIILEAYRFMKRTSSSRIHSPWTGLQHTSNHVFRGVLSYFMLPLVALSTYQLDNAGILPAYHTTLAALFIAVILIAFAWLLRQIPTRSLGILIFDNSNRYRQMSPVGTTTTTQEKSFVLVLFLLSFIRGVTIGGLQISAVAQLVALILCEIVLLASIMAFQAYSILSIGTTSAVARLCSLFLMLAFIPGLGSDTAKAVIGYAILAIHATMLAFGFLIPIVYSLVKLSAARRRPRLPNVSPFTQLDGACNWTDELNNQAYGLRQLRRRRNSRNNLSEFYNVSPLETGVPKETLGGRQRPARTARTTSGPDNPSTTPYHHGQQSTAPNRYYRPPRISRSSASVLSSQRQGSTPPESPSTDTFSSSSPTSTRRDPAVNLSASHQYQNTARASSSTEATTNSGTSSTRSSGGDMPLGPRWGDYSFREADLFYNASPPPSSKVIVPKTRPSAPLKQESTPSLRLWTKITGSQPNSHKEKSFQVVRPGLDRQTLQALHGPSPHPLSPSSSGHLSPSPNQGTSPGGASTSEPAPENPKPAENQPPAS